MKKYKFRAVRKVNGGRIEGDYYKKQIYDVTTGKEDLRHYIGWQAKDEKGRIWNDYEEILPETLELLEENKNGNYYSVERRINMDYKVKLYTADKEVVLMLTEKEYTELRNMFIIYHNAWFFSENDDIDRVFICEDVTINIEHVEMIELIEKV